MNSKLYFAYGSNMDLCDFRNFCIEKNLPDVTPEMELVSVVALRGHDLIFNYYSTRRKAGAANIVSCDGKNVYGLLYRVSPDALNIIRKKEGHPNNYKEIELEVEILMNKEKKKVLSYIVVKEKEQIKHQPPTVEYLNLILENAKKNNFPVDYIEKLTKIPTL